MFIDNIIPSPSLREFIRIYRIMDFYFPDGAPQFPKLYTPRPEICLQFYPKEKEKVQYPGYASSAIKATACISGQQTVMHSRFVPKDFLSVQVIFQPGALHRITGMPANQLNDLTLPVEKIFGRGIEAVNEQLLEAANYREMIGVIENFLGSLIKKNVPDSHPIIRIARLMSRDAEQNSLDWYIKEACICQRQFDRKFIEITGIAPKKFLKLIRFDRAFRMKNRLPAKDWLTIAIHCGYHDYQHLVKDYKEFTGLTPTQFFDYDNKGPDRILGISET